MTGIPALRVGRIPYANLLPIFHALEEGGAPEGIAYVEGHPSELNRRLREGGLDISPSSSIEYAMRPYRPRFGLDHWREIFGFSKWLLANSMLRYGYNRADARLLGKLAVHHAL